MAVGYGVVELSFQVDVKCDCDAICDGREREE